MCKKGIDLLTSQMKGEWPRVPVSDIATAVIGGTPRRSVAEYWDGNLPWATAKDVARVPSRYLDEVQENITEAGLESSTTKLMPAGTVVITARGTVGALAQLRREMAFNQTCYAILPGDSINNNFLFYALKGTIAEMRALTYGTVFDTITRRTFDDWLLPLPPLTEQRAIAHILGTLDDKIELNRRMNETLEEMARAIFKSWFVDFDPVRAKMDGSWRRGESLPGMPAEMYDLFPERLVDSELGEIPEGWGVKSLGEVAEVSSGKRPKIRHTVSSVDASVPLWGGNGPMAFVPSPLINYPVILTGRVGTLGTVFRVTSPIWASDNTLIIRAKNPTNFEYLFNAVKLVNFDSLNRGSTQPLLTQTDLKSQLILLPSASIIEYFHEVTEKLYARCDLSHNVTSTLAGLRDTLLPKLISGELRVRDAEKFMESVV